MNKEKVYLKGYVVGHAADTLGYIGLQVQLQNMDIVEIDESLVYRNIDEPQKPVVKQFVADWIEYCKNTSLSLVRALKVSDVDFYNYANQEDHSRLIDFLGSAINQETFALAWINGYTVEEEKRYRVKMKNAYYNKYPQFLCETDNGIFWAAEKDLRKTKFTRKELEQAGFGWVFDGGGRMRPKRYPYSRKRRIIEKQVLKGGYIDASIIKSNDSSVTFSDGKFIFRREKIDNDEVD